MDILAIESSCDETAAAVIRDGREIISSVVATQIEEHKLYGGVVPEIASRRHCESIVAVVDEALQKAGMKAQDVRRDSRKLCTGAYRRAAGRRQLCEGACAVAG